jgi:opacity protein-like surface antigen
VKQRILFLGIVLLALVPQLAGAAVPLANSQEDRAAKQAIPPAGKALVYVYRQRDAGPAESPTIWLNRSALGRLAPLTYAMQAVNPGRVDVRAGGVGAKMLTLRCQEGRIYFVQLVVDRAGLAQLGQVSYGKGRQDMRTAHLIRAGSGRDTAERRAPERAGGAGRFALILKAGGFQLSSDSQTILAAERNFTAAAATWGLEGEWRTADGLAFGGELFGHSHDYTTTGLAESGSVAITNIMLNAKKYFRAGSTAQPYVGMGLGAVTTSFSGALTGSASGFALQAMTGVDFRWQRAGLYTELKLQKAESKDTNGQKVDASGMGLFVGVSVPF